jgi:hypothetical protein
VAVSAIHFEGELLQWFSEGVQTILTHLKYAAIAATFSLHFISPI